jgi:signal transduction histidine kinase
VLTNSDLAQLVERLEHGVAVWRAAGPKPLDLVLEYVNGHFMQVVGQPCDRWVGHSLKTIVEGWEEFPVAEAAVTSVLLQACRDQRAQSYHDFLRLRGRTFTVEVVPLGQRMAATLWTDVTARVDALHKRRSDLERTTYVLSHDLRKPLRHVVGFAEAFLEDYGQLAGLDETAHEYIAEMCGGARRMEWLLDGIFQFAKMGELDEAVRVEPGLIWKDVLRDNARDLKGAEVRVAGEVSPVLGSRGMIYQLLGNVVANSIKFRRADRTLRLVLQEARPSPEGRVLLEIEDNGVGIPFGQRVEAFDLFRRVGPQAQHTEGLGVGLAVCARVVEAHGGSIEALESSSGGTTIRFDLPSATAAATT